jgi:hypothetical protein
MAYKNKSTISVSVFMVSNFFLPTLIKNKLNTAVFGKNLIFQESFMEPSAKIEAVVLTVKTSLETFDSENAL